MPEFRAIEIGFDLETGVYFANSTDPAYRHLVCEAKSIDALQRKIAKLLDTEPKRIELRLSKKPR
jgi:hypothetical protein